MISPQGFAPIAGSTKPSWRNSPIVVADLARDWIVRPKSDDVGYAICGIHPTEAYIGFRIENFSVGCMKEGGHAILPKQTLKSPLESTNRPTSLLYHAFSVRGYQQTRIEFVDAAVQFHVTPNEKSICCSNCGSDDVVLSGFKEREFRSTPIGTKPTTIVAQLPRVRCHQCGFVRQIEVGFAEPRRSYTKGWVKHALELSRKMTIKDVAQTLGVSWDMIKEIKKNYLQVIIKKRSQGHSYLTGVDLSLSRGNGDLVEFSVFETKEVSDCPDESSGSF